MSSVMRAQPGEFRRLSWVVLTLAAACGGSGPEDPGGGAVITADPNGISHAESGVCQSPAEGCPCSSEGVVATCKGSQIHIGDYTSCAPGERTCHSGFWGPCLSKTVHSN